MISHLRCAGSLAPPRPAVGGGVRCRGEGWGTGRGTLGATGGPTLEPEGRAQLLLLDWRRRRDPAETSCPTLTGNRKQEAIIIIINTSGDIKLRCSSLAEVESVDVCLHLVVVSGTANKQLIITPACDQSGSCDWLNVQSGSCDWFRAGHVTG